MTGIHLRHFDSLPESIRHSGATHVLVIDMPGICKAQQQELGVYLTGKAYLLDQSFLATPLTQTPPKSPALKEWAESVKRLGPPLPYACIGLPWVSRARRVKKGESFAQDGNPMAKGFEPAMESLALFASAPSSQVLNELRLAAQAFASLNGLRFQGIYLHSIQYLLTEEPEERGLLTADQAESRLEDLLQDVQEALEPHDNHRGSDSQYDDPDEWWLRPLEAAVIAALNNLRNNR